jgi:hypothetical protein
VSNDVLLTCYDLEEGFDIKRCALALGVKHADSGHQKVNLLSNSKAVGNEFFFFDDCRQQLARGRQQVPPTGTWGSDGDNGINRVLQGGGS